MSRIFFGCCCCCCCRHFPLLVFPYGWRIIWFLFVVFPWLSSTWFFGFNSPLFGFFIFPHEFSTIFMYVSMHACGSILFTVPSIAMAVYLFFTSLFDYFQFYFLFILINFSLSFSLLALCLCLYKSFNIQILSYASSFPHLLHLWLTYLTSSPVCSLARAVIVQTPSKYYNTTNTAWQASK